MKQLPLLMENAAEINGPARTTASSLRHSAVKCGPRTLAFTLTELIAVLAAISLLAVVLVPAVARSDDQGSRTVCANNLRQLGMASMMYANDNRDYLAFPNWGSGVTPGWLYSNINNQIPDPGPYGAYATNKFVAYSTGLWFQYVRDPRNYLCPVDIESTSYTGRPDGGVNVRSQRLCSFVMNGAVCGYSTSYGTCRISDIWNPGCYLLWGPDENFAGMGIPGAFDYGDGANYPDRNECVERLHTTMGGLAVTVSGDVRFLSARTFAAESLAPGKSLLWWSPFGTTGR